MYYILFHFICCQQVSFFFFLDGTFCSLHRISICYRKTETFWFWYLISAVHLAHMGSILRPYFPVLALFTDQKVTLKSRGKPVPQQQLRYRQRYSLYFPLQLHLCCLGRRKQQGKLHSLRSEQNVPFNTGNNIESNSVNNKPRSVVSCQLW